MGFVLDALEQALHARRPVHRGGLIITAIEAANMSRRLAEAGIEPSVSVGNSYDSYGRDHNGFTKPRSFTGAGRGARSRPSSSLRNGWIGSPAALIGNIAGRSYELSVRHGGVQTWLRQTRCGSGFHLWGGRYDREARDTLVVQDEVAGKIVASLVDKLSVSEADRLAGGRGQSVFVMGLAALGRLAERTLSFSSSLFGGGADARTVRTSSTGA